MLHSLPTSPPSPARRRGVAAVAFILVFPIFLLIVSIIVQYAVITNAKTMVDNAARVAARSAATCLPDEQPDRVLQAGRMALVPVSPQAQVSVDDEGVNIANGLKGMGIDVPDSFAARYTYAMQASTISWSPQADFLHSRGQEVEVTVVYRLYLTVPGAMRIMSANRETVAGVTGRFIDITAKAKVQTAHGRQSVTNGDGWPQ